MVVEHHDAEEEQKMHSISFPPEVIERDRRRKALIKWIALAGFCAFVLFLLTVIW